MPGPATDALCKAARQHKVTVVVGINERDGRYSRGTLYNSLLFISREGEILGVHRKLIPTHAERIVWGPGDGSTLHVFDTPHGRLGGLVCWEHWMPLARFAMHAKAEQIHVAAWPEAPEIHHLASRHYAFEGRCFVICAGSYLTAEDLPPDFELAEAMGANGEFGQDEGVLMPGGSGIIGPDASWLAGPVVGRETIVYAEADLARIGEEQTGPRRGRSLQPSRRLPADGRRAAASPGHLAARRGCRRRAGLAGPRGRVGPRGRRRLERA